MTFQAEDQAFLCGELCGGQSQGKVSSGKQGHGPQPSTATPSEERKEGKGRREGGSLRMVRGKTAAQTY